MKLRSIPMEGAKVAVQGFGNVGSVSAYLCPRAFVCNDLAVQTRCSQLHEKALS